MGERGINRVRATAMSDAGDGRIEIVPNVAALNVKSREITQGGAATFIEDATGDWIFVRR
jgi:hypothetical protein